MAAYPTPHISALFPRGIPDPYLREFEIRRQLRDAGIPGLNFNQNDTRYPAMQSLLYARPELDPNPRGLRGRGHRRGRSEGEGEGEGEGRRGDRRSHNRAHSHGHTHTYTHRHNQSHGQNPRQRAVSDMCRDSSKGEESGGGHFQYNDPRTRESGGRMANNDSDRLAIPIPIPSGDFAAPAPSPVPTPFHRRHRSAEHVVRQEPHNPHHSQSHPHQAQPQSQQTGQQTGSQPSQRPQAQSQVQAQQQPQPLIRVHDSNSDSDDDDRGNGDEGNVATLAPPPSYEEATMNMGTVGTTDVGSMRRETQRGVTVPADKDMNRDRNRDRISRSQVVPERRAPLLALLSM